MKDTSSKITIVVPFRHILGKADSVDPSLRALIHSLEIVSRNVEEIIFVNDHSTDASLAFLSKCGIQNVRLLNLTEDLKGKKAALEVGVNAAKTEYIWTLDSDVEVKDFHVEEFQRFQSSLKAELVILPVRMKSEVGFLNMLQTLEWRYLQFLTWSSARLKMPMMCNGANLVFKRKLFLKNIESHRTISSGDDMFLLSHVLKSKGKIDVCWGTFGAVEIAPVSSWVEAISQRLRWAGKTAKLPFTKSTFFHVIFTLFSAMHVLALVGLFELSLHLMCAYFLMIKVLVEVFCMRGVFSIRMSGMETAVAFLQMLLYPVFSLVIFISSLFFKPKWKGRRVSLK
jgi:cellulose synthase/poly-beta-1,6-N-acetylglucosamine synthase-like glycosyltransferase